MNKSELINQYYETVGTKGNIKEMMYEYNQQFLAAWHQLDNPATINCYDKVMDLILDYLEILDTQDEIERQMTVLFNQT